MVLLRISWVDGVGDIFEFFERKEVLKFWVGVSWREDCFSLFMVLGEFWEVFFWDGGKSGFGFDFKDDVSVEVILELFEVIGGWFVDDKFKVVRGLFIFFSVLVFLRGDILMVLVRIWLKIVIVCIVGIVGCWEGKIKLVVEGKFWEVLSRKVL